LVIQRVQHLVLTEDTNSAMSYGSICASHLANNFMYCNYEYDSNDWLNVHTRSNVLTDQSASDGSED